ncbi:MAG: DUF4153 domain-containing protein [Gaiellaceae bacterium]
MSRGTKVGMALAAVALLLGILGDFLLQGQPLGLNVALWTTAFVVALTALIRIAQAPLHQGRRLMVAPLLIFAVMFVWHSSPLLVAANLLALAAAVTMGALRSARGPLRATTLSDYGNGLVGAATSAAVGTGVLLMRDIRWTEVTRRGRSERAAAVARGLALGVPLLVLFGGLFVAADAVFGQLVSSTIPSVDDELVGRIVLVGILSWLTGGLLRDLLATRPDAKNASAARARLGGLEIGIALAILDLLFLAFVVVQFRYLFGGSGLVESKVSLTYAEYARHGFFQLVAVTGLTLGVLLAADWALADRNRRVFRWLAAALLALLGVVIASALQRMRLYMQEYGLTELRIYATGIILWLGVLSAWFAVTVLRGKRHAFAVGALVAGFVATLALNVLSPDALIARTNVTRPAADVEYLAQLSDDAVPTLVSRIRDLPSAQRAVLAQELLTRESSTHDWRSWNLARTRAEDALRVHRAELQALVQSSP